MVQRERGGYFIHRNSVHVYLLSTYYLPTGKTVNVFMIADVAPHVHYLVDSIVFVKEHLNARVTYYPETHRNCPQRWAPPF